MFRSPKDHPQAVSQALLKLPLCIINMYDYVGDVYFTGMLLHHLHKRTR